MYESRLQRIKPGKLASLRQEASEMTSAGKCCPKLCGIDRGKNKPPCGAIATGVKAASFAAHRGEEPPVSGTNGAGNVFLSGCTLHCVFCQNFPFSQLNNGKNYTNEIFAEKMLELQNVKKVHNINLTTSDHYLLEILEALSLIKDDLVIPVANNCSGYFLSENLALTAPVTDIFLFDLKYSDEACAARYSNASDYVTVSQSAANSLLDFGYEWVEEDGLLKQGVIFRHLMLPGNAANTIGVLDFAASLRDRGLFFKFSLMCQYFPAWKAVMHPGEYPELQETLTDDEYEAAVDRMDTLGLDGWVQDMHASGGC